MRATLHAPRLLCLAVAALTLLTAWPALAEWGDPMASQWGAESMPNFAAALERYQPSRDDAYLMEPPAAGPAWGQPQYFVWTGEIRSIEEAHGVVARTQDYQLSKLRGGWEVFVVQDGPVKGFVFRDVKKAFTPLDVGRFVTVVGRYTSNIEVQQKHGGLRLMPVLTGCYVRAAEPPGAKP